MTDLIKAASAQQKPQLKTDITQQPQHFFTVSTFKLIVMLVATLGLYNLYWSYKNWVFIKHKTGRDISPFWRTVFGILWIYSFFKYIIWYIQIMRHLFNSTYFIICKNIYI